MKLLLSVLLQPAASIILLAAAAQGGTLTVNSTADHAADGCDAECTMRDAVAAAQANDTIVFASSVTGTIALTSGEILLNKNLTITGPGARLLTISGNNASRIFTIHGAASVSVSGLNLMNGLVSTSGGQGGAIYVVGRLTLNACSFSANAVRGMDQFVGQLVSAGTGEGGAIYVTFNATLIARNCSFYSNTAEATSVSGGAIWSAGNVALVNSTISFNVLKPNSNLLTANNEAATGGGIFQKSGRLTVVNSTIHGNSYSSVHNTSNGVGGGIAMNDGIVSLQNTIVAFNSSPSNFRSNVAGTFASRGYNLIEDPVGSTGWIATDKTNPTPSQLSISGFANHGGPTNTHVPLSSSYAIDHGADSLAMDPGPNLLPGDGDDILLSTDQRGYPRFVGAHVDIGSVEYEPAQAAPSFVVNTTDEHDDGLCGVGDCSLLEALNASNANAANNSVITFAPSAYGTINNTVAPGGLSIIRPVNINGPGAQLVAVSGASVSRLFTISSAGAVAISGLTIRDGQGSSDGGAMRYTGNGTLTISSCRFFNNATVPSFSGGALYTIGKVDISGSEFGGNKGGGAGALYPRFGSVMTVTGCSFHDNEAFNTTGSGLGGAILLWDGPTVTVSGCTFTNNKAMRAGGAVYVLPNSTLNVDTTTFSGNSVTATFQGGAIYNDGTLNLQSSTLSGNAVASGQGAGIYNSGTCNLTNVTLSGNLAPGNSATPSYGGGIYSVTGSLTLLNVTMSGNSAFFGGAIHVQSGAVSLKNTALAKGGSGDNCSGFTGGTANANFSDDGTCAFGVDRDNVSLLLRALGNYGGPTQTHLPQPNSRVIDRGTSAGAPPSDQRGVLRPKGAQVDAGAVEFAPSDIPPSPTPTATATATATPTPTATPTATPATTLANISTRLRVETGDNVLIGGFIITGTQPKKVILRAIGPSLNLAGQLANPTLELFQGSTLLGSNDDWQNQPAADKQAVIDSTIPPANDLESALVRTLPANGTGYTAIVRGANNGTGIGVVEAYDLDRNVNSKLANISTRGLVQTGDNVLIAGTIILGNTAQKVIVRALGPSLSVPGKMEDPTLELRNQNGGLLEANDNWVDSPNKAAIIASTIPPSNDMESAIVQTLAPAPYTAIVRGVNNTTGIAVVEVYALQ